jgi:hypothetical protein
MSNISKDKSKGKESVYSTDTSELWKEAERKKKRKNSEGSSQTHSTRKLTCCSE